MNSLALALKKANVVTNKDVERVNRQERIVMEQKRKADEKKKINKLIISLNPRLRDAVKNIRRKNPEVMTIDVLEKLNMAPIRPWILSDPDVIQAMSHTMLETIRLDFEKAKQENGNDKRD